MAEKIDDLTVNYTEDGIQKVKELDKVILSKGAWTTIIFRYQEWDGKTQNYSPEKYTIRRYQKKSGLYQQRSKFNISSKEQAKSMVTALKRWIDD